MGGIGHQQASARRLVVGPYEHPPVRPDGDRGLRITFLDHGDQVGVVDVGGGEVRQVDVVARRCSLGGVDHQPMTVSGDSDGVVVRDPQSAAEDLGVGVGVGAEVVQPHAPVVLGLVWRDRGGVLAAHVVKRVSAGQPRHRREPGAVDGPVDDLAGGDVHDPQHGLLGAAFAHQERQLVALPGRLVAVQGGAPGRVPLHRVDEWAFGAVGIDGVQHPELLPGLPPAEELPVAAPHR